MFTLRPLLFISFFSRRFLLYWRSYNCFHTCRSSVSFAFPRMDIAFFLRTTSFWYKRSLPYLAFMQMSFWKVTKRAVPASNHCIFFLHEKQEYLIVFELSVILCLVFWLLQDFFVDLFFADDHLPTELIRYPTKVNKINWIFAPDKSVESKYLQQIKDLSR